MISGIFFLLVVIILTLFYIAKSDEETKKGKIILSVALVIIVVFAIIYEMLKSSGSEKKIELLNAFNQGRILQCKQNKVDKQRFLYVSGTQTFSGKPNIKEVGGLIFEISECEIFE